MRVPKLFWFMWIGTGLALEASALLSKDEGDTLTEVTVETFPAWLIVGLLTWALVHFRDRYDEW